MRRTFIVGCPRSGIGMVKAMLARHPALQILPDTALFEQVYADSARRWGDAHPAPGPTGVAHALGWTRKQDRELFAALQGLLPAGASSHERAPLRRSTLTRRSLALFDQLAQSAGHKIWLEATPSHLLYVRDIEALAPDARFIHVIRQGADVLASLLDTGMLVQDAHAFGSGLVLWSRRWTRAMSIHTQHAQQARHHLLFVDDLFERPANEWSRLCAFLGIDPNPIVESMASELDQGIDGTWMLGFRGLPRHQLESLLGTKLQAWMHEAQATYDQLHARVHAARGETGTIDDDSLALPSAS